MLDIRRAFSPRRRPAAHAPSFSRNLRAKNALAVPLCSRRLARPCGGRGASADGGVWRGRSAAGEEEAQRIEVRLGFAGLLHRLCVAPLSDNDVPLCSAPLVPGYHDRARCLAPCLLDGQRPCGQGGPCRGRHARRSAPPCSRQGLSSLSLSPSPSCVLASTH